MGLFDIFYLVLEVLKIVFYPFDILFAIIFGFVPFFLRTFSITMFILTLCVILDMYEKRAWKIFLYIFSLVYSIYSLGILENVMNLNVLDWTTLIFAIVAPICMIIIGKKVINTTIKGYKIFNYYILWLIYLIVSIIWWVIYPAEVIILYVLIFVFFSLFFIWIFNKQVA